MKVLITKSDGTPTKSKVFAIKFLQDKGISEDCLIQENGQFFYEEVSEEVFATQIPKNALPKCEDIFEHSEGITPHPSPLPPERGVSWETPVFTGSERTELFIPGTDIKAAIIAKHPGGQIRPTSSFEIAIGQENFIMSLDLVSKLFKVRG